MKPLPWVLSVLLVMALAGAAFHTRFTLIPADSHQYLPTAFLLDRWTGRVQVITLHDADGRFSIESPVPVPVRQTFTIEQIENSR